VAAQLKDFYPDSNCQSDLRYMGGSFYLASIAVSGSFSKSMQLSTGSYAGGGIGGVAGGGGFGLR